MFHKVLPGWVNTLEEAFFLFGKVGEAKEGSCRKSSKGPGAPQEQPFTLVAVLSCTGSGLWAAGRSPLALAAMELALHLVLWVQYGVLMFLFQQTK